MSALIIGSCAQKKYSQVDKLQLDNGSKYIMILHLFSIYFKGQNSWTSETKIAHHSLMPWFLNKFTCQHNYGNGI